MTPSNICCYLHNQPPVYIF